MSYNIKQWLTNSGVELARGAAAGLAITVVVFFCFWTPPPTPRIGEKQATVIMQYGPPDEIVATEQSPTERQHYPYTYLRYRSGFFKSSVTVIVIDNVADRVLNVTQDGDAGY